MKYLVLIVSCLIFSTFNLAGQSDQDSKTSLIKDAKEVIEEIGAAGKKRYKKAKEAYAEIWLDESNLSKPYKWDNVISEFSKQDIPKIKDYEHITLVEFMNKLRNKRSPGANNHLSEDDLDLINAYYLSIKNCSQCKVIDCRQCDSVEKVMERLRRLPGTRTSRREARN